MHPCGVTRRLLLPYQSRQCGSSWERVRETSNKQGCKGLEIFIVSSWRLLLGNLTPHRECQMAHLDQHHGHGKDRGRKPDEKDRFSAITQSTEGTRSHRKYNHDEPVE